MRIWGLFFSILLLAACASPTAVSTSPTTEAPTEQPPTAEPTMTEMPTQEPTATTSPTEEATSTTEAIEEPTEIPATATAAPTEAPKAATIFTSNRDIQAALILDSETPAIERIEGNRYLNGGAIIFHEGEFHSFTNVFNNWPGETETYYYTSADGTMWSRVVEDPIFTVDEVPLEGRGALALSGLVLPDGTWVLYYHTFTSSSQQGAIGRATASNPAGPWTFDEEPVLSPGIEGTWDELQVMRVNVLSNDDNDGFVMYYAGVNQDRESRIGMATSTDGINWEKYNDPATTSPRYAESDPILEASLDWEGDKLGRPEVVRTDDGWVMLYEGGRGSLTGVAISQDGVNFDRYEANPILTRENMVEGYSFFQGAFFHEEDRYYYLIEAGNGPVGTDIFLYTIDGSLLEQ